MEDMQNNQEPIPPINSSKTAKPRKPYRIINGLLDSLLVISVMILLSVILTIATMRYDPAFVQRIEITGLLNLASFSLVIGLKWKRWKPDLSQLFSKPARPGLVVPLMFLCAAGLTVVLSEMDNMLRPVIGDSLLYEILENIFSRNLGAVFFAVGIIAPLSEEFFFRGYLISRLEETVSPLAAVFATALLFGIFHLNPSQIISGFFTGCILGYAFVTSRSLIYPMLFHFFYNSIPVACLAAGISVPGYTDTAAFSHQPLWFTVSGFALLAVALILLLQALPPLPAGSTGTSLPRENGDKGPDNG